MRYPIFSTGLSDSGYLPRGSRLSWRGTVTSDVFPSGNPFSREPNKELTGQIRATSRAMVAALNEIVWAVNPKNDSLNELLGYFGYFAEEFFRGSAIRCRLEPRLDVTRLEKVEPPACP